MNNLRRSKRIDQAFRIFGIGCTLFGLLMLVIFIGNILIDGLDRIDWDFLTSLPSRKAERAGILTAWTGTAWILGLTALIAIPVGVAAGVYLEEYGRKNRIASIVEVNIANLAGVPSIIYGLLGLEIFGRLMQ
ncbi:MAG TPA: phosphate ABC transporter, permease protein PstA, partial [Cyclobacteriaceae bacterium]|nr:phosphate ABC transporter, permease protein PstA [Cyclobacteriaceae bacterium]